MKNFGLSCLTAANPRQGAQFDQRAAAAVLDPSPTAMRRLALAGVISTAVIIATGAAVRLSESGLGCPDWPECTRSSLVAAHSAGDPMVHTWIEFGNRLVTVAITLIAVAVFVAAWRFRPGGQRRRDGGPQPGRSWRGSDSHGHGYLFLPRPCWRPGLAAESSTGGRRSGQIS